MLEARTAVGTTASRKHPPENVSTSPTRSTERPAEPLERPEKSCWTMPLAPSKISLPKNRTDRKPDNRERAMVKSRLLGTWPRSRASSLLAWVGGLVFSMTNQGQRLFSAMFHSTRQAPDQPPPLFESLEEQSGDKPQEKRQRQDHDSHSHENSQRKGKDEELELGHHAGKDGLAQRNHQEHRHDRERHQGRCFEQAAAGKEKELGQGRDQAFGRHGAWR